MATLADMVNEVIVLTGRPDLTARIEQAVRAATIKAHSVDFFDRDLVERPIQWTTPAYIQSLPYKQIFPRFRAIKYIRKYANSVPGAFFKDVLPELTQDSYGVDLLDIYYLAGANLELRSSTMDNYMLIGAYEYPDTSAAGYSSWIADSFSPLIYTEAASAIHRSTGNKEQVALLQNDLAQLYTELRTNFLPTVGV